MIPFYPGTWPALRDTVASVREQGGHVKIPEKVVAELVAEASLKMSDPNYSAVMVGGFVQSQSAAVQYISAHEQELGGADGVVNVIFHAALIAQCFQRANNRSVRAISFEELDRVATGDRNATLERAQPALLGYIEANIEGEAMKRIVVLLALSMDWVT